MQLALLFAGAVLAFTMTRVQAHEVVVCPPNSQLFISDSRSLLPLENIQASSESQIYPGVNIVNSAAGWCTNAPSFIGEYVNFTFTRPVVLTMIISASVFTNHYVNNFSIQYRPSEDNNVSFFDIYGITEMPQNFFIPQPGPQRFFTLEESIVTTKLQLTINDGVAASGSDTCWVVAMLGCTLSEAEIVGTECEMTSTMTPSAMTSSTTTNLSSTSLAPLPTCRPGSGVDTTSNQASRGGATREEVLAIALPIALGTIAIVTVIVAIGVVICVKYQRKEKWSSSVQYAAQTSELVGVAPVGDGRPQEGTLKEVDNILYEEDTGDTGESRQRAETVREVQNILYEDTSREERTYEPMPDSNTGYSVPFQPHDRIQTSRNESYSICNGRKNELPQTQ